MNASPGTAQEGAAEYYDRIAASYDGERFSCRCGMTLNAVESEIVRALIPCNSIVLDVGAGTGRFSTAAATVGSNVIAIDASHNMIRMASEQRPALHVSGGITFVMGDAASLPFSAAMFDVLISVKLLSHCRDIHPYISEMARVLKPGGLLILDVPHRLAGVYGRFGPGLPIQSYTDYVHPLSEIEESLRRSSIDLTRRLTYSALPVSLVHSWLCPRTRIVPTSLLRLLIGSRRGLLSFVEGTKRR